MRDLRKAKGLVRACVSVCGVVCCGCRCRSHSFMPIVPRQRVYFRLSPPFGQLEVVSRIRSSESFEPWRPRDVPRAGRPPRRRAARGRPSVRPSAARRGAGRSAVPAGASRRRVATTPKAPVRTVFSSSVFPSEFHAIPGLCACLVIAGRVACVQRRVPFCVYMSYKATGCPVVLCFEER